MEQILSALPVVVMLFLSAGCAGLGALVRRSAGLTGAPIVAQMNRKQ